MSSQAVGWVFKHSPYKHAHRLVHLAIADVVNDDYDNLVWLSQKKLAAKTLVTRQTVVEAIQKMVDEGYLELVKVEAGHPNTYRFLMPEGVKNADTPDDEGVKNADRGVSENPTGGVKNGEIAPLLLTQKNPSNNPTHAREVDGDFELLWEGYPKRNGVKVGKANAFKVWQRLSKADRVDAVKALPAYAALCGDFPKDCERYLRGRVWVDYLDAPVTTPRPSNGCSTSIPGRMTSRQNTHNAIDEYRRRNGLGPLADSDYTTETSLFPERP